GGAEEKSLLGSFREADEAGFAIGVGSDLEIELVKVHKSISDVDADVGGVNGLAIFIGNDEIGGAGAETGVDFGHGFRVDGGSVGGFESGWHTLIRVRPTLSRWSSADWELAIVKSALALRVRGYQRSLRRTGCESIIFGTVTRPCSESSI